MSLRLVGEVSLDGAGFERGLARLGEGAASTLKGMVLGAVGVYGLEQAMQRTIETADELVTTSKRLDLTVEQLQVLRQAAKDNNVEFTALAGAFEKLDVARAKALGGGRDAARYLQSFSKLGISAEDLQSKTAAELFQTQIAATVKMTNPEQIASPLRDIFGRAFGELTPVLKTDFEELDAKMHQYGAIMDTTTAVELKQFKEEMGLIGQVISAQIAPVLVKFAEGIYAVISGLGAMGTLLGSLFVNMVNADPRDRVLSPFETFAKAFGDARRDAQQYMDDRVDAFSAFEKRFQNISDDLNHPKPPNFGGEMGANEADARRRRERNGDSLVAVGNFLGAGSNLINNIAEQQLAVQRLQLLEQQATNGLIKTLISVGGASVGEPLLGLEFP